MRIAIVDDIVSDQEGLKSALAAQLDRLFIDAVILCFDSGAAFLTAAGRERFDLVFLDIYMGNENGVHTAEALRRFDTAIQQITHSITRIFNLKITILSYLIYK